jgi:peptide/nickel transport system permease protein
MDRPVAQASIPLRTPDLIKRTEAQPRTVWSEARRRFRRNRPAMISAVVLFALFVAVFVGPFFYTASPTATNFAVAQQMPTAEHPFGTDDLGRDMLARMLVGGRISLSVGLAAMMLAMSLGILVGALAGFFGGWLDTVLMRITDTFLALPILAVVLLIGSLYRDSLKSALGVNLGSIVLVIVVIGILTWMTTARLVRGSFLSLRQREFVEAAHALGQNDFAIMVRHILPNALGPIVVSATLAVGAAIITESVLSFLGQGLPSDVPTWGSLLFENKEFVEIAPHLVLWPGLAIFITVLCVNYLGDGLRDALDPRGK